MTVLFNSARPLGRCENLTAVWNAYDGEKVFERGGYRDVSRARGCNTVLTDEFVTVKRPDQRVVMIAHGLTGGKMYGRDQSKGQFVNDYPPNVDWYVVSSEAGRKFAATAAGIDIEKCIPLGFPRTDAYFGKKKGDGKTFLARYERAYLYVPTFRSWFDEPTPKIDYAAIDEMLEDDEILVVKRHMNQPEPLVQCDVERIVEVSRKEPSTPYLIDCDVLATDFSSILFDGYVLGKPSVLTADGDDAYLRTRGMYWKYPQDYGSRFVAVEGNEERFLAHLRAAHSTGMRGADKKCRKNTSGACDGHSVERVVELLRRLECES